MGFYEPTNVFVFWGAPSCSAPQVAFFSKLRSAVFLLVLMMPARSLAEFAAGGLSQTLGIELGVGKKHLRTGPKLCYTLF